MSAEVQLDGGEAGTVVRLIGCYDPTLGVGETLCP